MLIFFSFFKEKLRKEVKEVVGDEDMKDEHLRDLKYLEMVIRETVRLFPIAPLMVRELKGDLQLGN